MKRLASLGAMAPVGVGPGVAKPTPGDELSVGEALTKKRQDLAEFMGCSVEVLDVVEYMVTDGVTWAYTMRGGGYARRV